MGTSFYPVAKLMLGKGSYHVTAKGEAFVHEIPGTTWWAAVTCQLRITHPNGEEILDSATFEVSEDGPEYGTFTPPGRHAHRHDLDREPFGWSARTTAAWAAT